MAETPETYYVRSDDVHISYQVLGDGPSPLQFQLAHEIAFSDGRALVA